MGGGESHRFSANLDLKMVHFDGFDKDIKENFSKYAKIYDLFADNLSRHIFQNLIDFKISGDVRYIRGFKLAHDEQYFEDFLNLPAKPTFVDAGGYTGDTALQFISRYPNFEKIFVFEPEEQNISQAKQNLKNYSNIVCIQKGLSDENKTLRFSANNSASSVSEDGELTIEVARLDDIVDERVDFIKMDIEGSEGAAIEGAKQTIAKYHPTLAICVYHKKDDFWKIPQQILAIRNDYKIYLRHYTQGTDESVMYFVKNV